MNLLRDGNFRFVVEGLGYIVARDVVGGEMRFGNGSCEEGVSWTAEKGWGGRGCILESIKNKEEIVVSNGRSMIHSRLS